MKNQTKKRLWTIVIIIVAIISDWVVYCVIFPSTPTGPRLCDSSYGAYCIEVNLKAYNDPKGEDVSEYQGSQLGLGDILFIENVSITLQDVGANHSSIEGYYIVFDFKNKMLFEEDVKETRKIRINREINEGELYEIIRDDRGYYCHYKNNREDVGICESESGYSFSLDELGSWRLEVSIQPGNPELPKNLPHDTKVDGQNLHYKGIYVRPKNELRAPIDSKWALVVSITALIIAVMFHLLVYVWRYYDKKEEIKSITDQINQLRKTMEKSVVATGEVQAELKQTKTELSKSVEESSDKICKSLDKSKR